MRASYMGDFDTRPSRINSKRKKGEAKVYTEHLGSGELFS